MAKLRTTEYVGAALPPQRSVYMSCEDIDCARIDRRRARQFKQTQHLPLNEVHAHISKQDHAHVLAGFETAGDIRWKSARARTPSNSCFRASVAL